MPLTPQELDDLEAVLMEAPSLAPTTQPAGFEDGQMLIYHINSPGKKTTPKLIISAHPSMVDECGFEDLDFARVDYDTIRRVGVLVATEADCGTGATANLHKVKGSGVLRFTLPCKGPVAEVFGTLGGHLPVTLEVLGTKPSKLFFKLP